MDILRSTVTLAVVVYAVLYRAVNALDVLFTSLGFVHHDQEILSKFKFVRSICPVADATPAQGPSSAFSADTYIIS